MRKNVGHFASEEENPVKTQQFFGTVGSKMWKNVVNSASEEGKSYEKLRNFGFVGPRMWKNVGKPRLLVVMGPKIRKNVRNLASEKPKIASLEQTSREKRLHKHMLFGPPTKLRV